MNRLAMYLLALLITVMCVIGIAEAKDFSSANELQIYMRQNFYYQPDPIADGFFDYFEVPAVLEFSKMGDCDDFATYSWYNLIKLNIPAQRYCLYIETKSGYGIKKIVGHAITVFYDTDNTFSIFTNQYILKTNKTTPLDAIKDIYPSWKIIVEWNPHKYGLVTFDEFKKDVKLVSYATKEDLFKWLTTMEDK